MRALHLAPVLFLAACSGPQSVDDPRAQLETHPNSPARHMAAMEALDASPADPAYLEQLHRIIWVPGYTVEVREAALDRLAVHDAEELRRTIRQRLPNLNAWEWLERLCAIIVERGWVELSPALASSLSRPVPHLPDSERPEYTALAALHGPGRVGEVIFDLMIEHGEVWEQGFRTRCWTLLWRLGHRDRLIELLRTAALPEDDAMLLDLRAGALECGVIPANREEILWVRGLRQPEHAAFWSEAAAAIQQLPPARRAAIEIRDLPVVVAAARHDPDLLTAGTDDLLARLQSHLESERHYATGGRFDGPTSASTQRLREVADKLTYGDLAAMLLALRALEVPQVLDHLFDYAARDRADTSTEYGGVIDLDAAGRFQILEFPPRVRDHDQKFIASQAMFDAAYTALFHFHYHAQRVRNEEFAGPGYGDENYAQATRANCLVLTSVGEDRLNVDYYRHGGVVVDLGVVERPAGLVRHP